MKLTPFIILGIIFALGSIIGTVHTINLSADTITPRVITYMVAFGLQVLLTIVYWIAIGALMYDRYKEKHKHISTNAGNLSN